MVNYMKKDYSLFAIILCIIYWLNRITMTVINFPSVTIGGLQVADVLASIVTVISLSCFFSNRFLTRKQRKWLKIAYPLMIIFGVSFEVIVSAFRKFDNALDMCKYNEQCKEGTIFYNTKNEYIFFHKLYISCFKLENNYWNYDYQQYYETYLYNDDNYDVYAYKLTEEKYFISVKIIGDGKIDDIEDNTDKDFEMLKVAYDPNYEIHNFYGKIVDDFASYELKINGEKIEFKEKKQN